MKFIRVQGESKVSELLSRVFDLSGAAPSAKRVAAQLEKSNPELARLDELPTNALIPVPSELAEFVRDDQQVQPARLADEQFLEPTTKSLDELDQKIDASAITQRNDLTATINAARDPAVLALVKVVPGLQATLNQAVAGATATLDDLDATVQAKKDAAADLRQRMVDFIQDLGC